MKISHFASWKITFVDVFRYYTNVTRDWKERKKMHTKNINGRKFIWLEMVSSDPFWLNERWQSLLLVSFCHFVDLFWSQFRRLSVTIEIIKASWMPHCWIVSCLDLTKTMQIMFLLSNFIFSLYVIVWIVYFSCPDRYQQLIFNNNTQKNGKRMREMPNRME